jgi:hypothetical protein
MTVSLAGSWGFGIKEAEQNEHRFMLSRETMDAMVARTGRASDGVEIAGQ